MIKLISNLTTGELEIKNKKIATDNTLETPVYISLFGGNVEASTTTQRNEPGIDNLDWFGNLYQKEQNKEPFNSLTEKTIKTKALVSGNIKFFEQAILSDLNWLIKNKIAKETKPVVTITGNNNLKLEITIKRPDKTEEKYQYLYEVIR